MDFFFGSKKWVHHQPINLSRGCAWAQDLWIPIRWCDLAAPWWATHEGEPEGRNIPNLKKVMFIDFIMIKKQTFKLELKKSTTKTDIVPSFWCCGLYKFTSFTVPKTPWCSEWWKHRWAWEWGPIIGMNTSLLAELISYFLSNFLSIFIPSKAIWLGWNGRKLIFFEWLLTILATNSFCLTEIWRIKTSEINRENRNTAKRNLPWLCGKGSLFRCDSQVLTMLRCRSQILEKRPSWCFQVSPTT